MVKERHKAKSFSLLVKLITISTVIFYSSTPLMADGAGSTGAAFLSLPVGAKSISLGEIKSVAWDDPFNWTANPATTDLSSGSKFGLFHSQWLIDTFYDNLFYLHKYNNFIILGASLTYISSSEIEGYDIEGSKIGNIDNNSFKGTLGLTFIPINDLSFGINVSYFQDKLDEFIGKGYSFNAGVKYTPHIIPISFGLLIENIGPDISYDSTKEDLPLTLRAGISHIPLNLAKLIKVTIAAELVRTRYEDPYVCIGSEISIQNALELRMGFVADESQESNGFAAGIGFNISDKFSLDYSWIPRGKLGNFNSLSIAFWLPSK